MKQKYYYGPGEYYLYFTSSTSLMNSIGTVGEQAIIREDSLGGDSRRFVFTNPVTKISANNFKNCADLTSVTIPSSVTIIQANAFDGCYVLSSVTIESGVITIGDESFKDCALTSINIPSSVTSIGGKAFYGCGLLSITLNSPIDSLMTVGSLAFTMTYGIRNVPNYLVTINDSAPPVHISLITPGIQSESFEFSKAVYPDDLLFIMDGNEIDFRFNSSTALSAYSSKTAWSSLFNNSFINTVVLS